MVGNGWKQKGWYGRRMEGGAGGDKQIWDEGRVGEERERGIKLS